MLWLSIMFLVNIEINLYVVVTPISSEKLNEPSLDNGQ